MATKDVLAVEEPIDELRRWLLEDFRGTYDFADVRVERRATADGEDLAWYIHPLVDASNDIEWDARALGALDLAVRDKALELGLTYPWFVLVTTVGAADEPMEDDDETLFSD